MRYYICNKKGERQRCTNLGDLHYKHKPRWAIYRCQECGWMLCGECAREHFKQELRVGERTFVGGNIWRTLRAYVKLNEKEEQQ